MGGGGGGGVSTLRHKFYYMVVNRNELLIMCIPRFPKLKIHFNSDFLHYKELYNKVELDEHIHRSSVFRRFLWKRRENLRSRKI